MHPKRLGYSQAIVCPPSGFVFVSGSGCLGFDPKTGAFVDGGVEAQIRQALQNLKSVFKSEASGSELGKVVKTTVRMCTLFLRWVLFEKLST